MSSGRTELLNRAREDARIATEMDQAGRGKEAIYYYLRAAENLQHVFKFTKDEKMKQLYYDRIIAYIDRAEVLKKSGGKPGSSTTGKGDKDSDSDSELAGTIEGTIIKE